MMRNRAATIGAFILCVILALVYAATPHDSGTPCAPVPLGTPTLADSGTPTATESIDVYQSWLPYAANVPRATPTQIRATPYTPTRTPTSAATSSAYPAPPTRTPRPTATRLRATPTPVPIAAHVDAVSGTLRTMSVSVYVPMAGGVNGGACVGKSHELCFVQTGHAACGPSYPRGTIFLLPDTMPLFGLPARVVCRDRGSAVHDGALDVALVSADVQGDLARAFAWGRRRVVVGVAVP